MVFQTEPDERRYASLVKGGWVPRQRYEQAKAALDTARAQLAAAEAEARVAEAEAAYSILVADADGTVIETLGEPGQVISAGQPVVRIAQAGPREALMDHAFQNNPAGGRLGSRGQRVWWRRASFYCAASATIELRRCPYPNL